MKHNEPQGLGDTVAEYAKRLKLDKVAKAVATVAGKEDCGCSKRQQYLNEKFPYNKSK